MMKKLLLIFTLLTAVSFAVLGQGSTTSSIRGRIVDENGGTLIGATIQLKHEPSGTNYGTVSNVEGIYRIPNTRVGGPYTVIGSFVGYKDYRRENVYLTLGQVFEINIKLEVDEIVLEGVEIVANKNDIFDGTRNGASTNVGSELISTLPTASRNISDFTRLTPQARISGDNNISIAGSNNRYNSFFIDGANNTDAFGLEGSGTNGGGTGAPPISIDAIEQFTVNISPFDVTLAGFSGGAINAVTRSGTNEFEGSAYYFWRNENLTGKDPNAEIAIDDRERQDDFTAKTYGFRLGGPIVKDKLFFFANVELQRDDTPNSNQFSFDNYVGNATPTELNSLSQFFVNSGFDPGTFDSPVTDRLESERFLLKLDWNIHKNHRLAIRHSYNNIVVTDLNASNNQAINFSNSGEFTANETNSTSLELNSNFGSNFSNRLILARTKTVEDRDPINDGRLPFVTIEDGNANINIGPDAFGTGNLTEQSVFTITNNFNWYKGKHIFTLGTHNEFYSFRNLFLGQNFGDYSYNNINDFLTGAEPNGFTRSYPIQQPNVLGDEIESAAAIFDAYQLGFYIQDEFEVSSKLTVTGGIRLDVPKVTTDPTAPFDDFDTVTRPAIENFYDINGAIPGRSPKAQALISPRIGFNYDVKGDQSTQIRGGAGLFTGRTLFVWTGGAFTNSGGVVGRVQGTRLNDGTPLPYITNLDQLPVAGQLEGSNPISLPTGRLELFEEDFKYPQFFRSTLAVDKKLPLGLVGTLEAIYSVNLNNIDLRNVNINPNPIARTNSPANRPIFDGQAIDNRFNEIIVVGNTNKGNSYNFTAQLQKPFTNGFTGSIAYTFGSSRVVNDGTSSQLTSVWRRNEVTNNTLNSLSVTRSDFDPGSRIIANVSYRKEYANKFASTISLVYTGQSGNPFSYVINQSGGSRNLRREDIFQGGRPHDGDLIYVPTNASDINFVDIIDDGVVVATAEEQWNQFNAFIEADDYLNSRRGQFAERNVKRQPFNNVIDLKFVQDFYIELGNGKRNTLQFTADIFNFTNFLGNLFNENWGQIRTVNFNAFSLLDFRGFRDEANGDFTPTFQYGLGETAPDEIFNIDDSGINSSRWQAQLGVRYIFGN